MILPFESFQLLSFIIVTVTLASSCTCVKEGEESRHVTGISVGRYLKVSRQDLKGFNY